MKSEHYIVYYLAEHACEAMARALRRDLQRMRDGLLAGEDSGLATLWDELCVQVQGEESLLWDEYEDLVQDLALEHVRKLDGYTKAAIWYQTDDGMDHLCLLEDEQDLSSEDDFGVPDDDVARYVVREVMRLAGRWTNKRIRAYRDRDDARSEMDYGW